ncbi:MurR/RpiR family transcriptional regulator [Aquamicrobium sp. LC103]|uniref:MurR/RpiR family transcriptional regulator n=1 Tax=Aquamicrobium sp. LC103 TaxID=1120658 RepID=UPI00069C8F9A|nr:MurR/RpiR family transcriptional regulator [Aquamicrobium sp. LC103]
MNMRSSTAEKYEFRHSLQQKEKAFREVEDLLIDQFETLPRQLKIAANYILNEPTEVAWCSMRELARRAGVSHSTMMRLVHWIGFDKYEEVQSRYQTAIDRVGKSVDGAVQSGAQVDIDGFNALFSAQATRLTEGLELPKPFAEAARILAEAPQVYCLGLRSQYAVAHQFNYALSHFHNSTVLIDREIGLKTGGALEDSGPADALLAISTAPYARLTVEIAREAASHGVTIVAITDDRLSPLVRLARVSILVRPVKRFYFQSITPTLAAAEILAGLVAQRLNARARGSAELAGPLGG